MLHEPRLEPAPERSSHRRVGKRGCDWALTPTPLPAPLAGQLPFRTAAAGTGQAQVNGCPAPGNGPTLFQVQEELRHAGGRVLLPALGLRRGTALRQPVTVGRVARGPPQRLQGFRLGLAPLGGGWFTGGGMTFRGLRCGWIQQRRARRELLLVPTEEERASHTPGTHNLCKTRSGSYMSSFTLKTLLPLLQEAYKLLLSSVTKQMFS